MNYVEPLTAREQEVLTLAVQGLTNRQIAKALNLRVTTVRQHLNHVYSKLGVKSRIQAGLKSNLLIYIEWVAQRGDLEGLSVRPPTFLLDALCKAWAEDT